MNDKNAVGTGPLGQAMQGVQATQDVSKRPQAPPVFKEVNGAQLRDETRLGWELISVLAETTIETVTLQGPMRPSPTSGYHGYNGQYVNEGDLVPSDHQNSHLVRQTRYLLRETPAVDFIDHLRERVSRTDKQVEELKKQISEMEAERSERVGSHERVVRSLKSAEERLITANDTKHALERDMAKLRKQLGEKTIREALEAE